MVLENDGEAQVIINCLSVLQEAKITLVGKELFNFAKECEYLYNEVQKYKEAKKNNIEEPKEEY